MPLISSLTQAGGGVLLFRLLVLSRCGEGLVLLSPSVLSGSRLFYMEHALCCAGFQPSGVPQKLEQKATPAFCAFPIRAAQAARSLMGALSSGVAGLLPSTSPAPVPTRAGRVSAPCVSPRPSRQMSTIQNLRRSLIRNWRPVCTAVGGRCGPWGRACPFPLPPASSLWQGWAGL